MKFNYINPFLAFQSEVADALILTKHAQKRQGRPKKDSKREDPLKKPKQRVFVSSSVRYDSIEHYWEKK